MSTQRILAEQTVSVTEMRKHPTDYFTDHPIAVLNRNQTEGYMLGKELFERISINPVLKYEVHSM
jgi:antitoxin YafN